MEATKEAVKTPEQMEKYLKGFDHTFATILSEFEKWADGQIALMKTYNPKGDSRFNNGTLDGIEASRCKLLELVESVQRERDECKAGAGN
jgi:hypothetical protein